MKKDEIPFYVLQESFWIVFYNKKENLMFEHCVHIHADNIIFYQNLL